MSENYRFWNQLHYKILATGLLITLHTYPYIVLSGETCTHNLYLVIVNFKEHTSVKIINNTGVTLEYQQ